MTSWKPWVFAFVAVPTAGAILAWLLVRRWWAWAWIWPASGVMLCAAVGAWLWGRW